MREKNNSSCLGVTIISLIASIITIYVFVTGRQSLNGPEQIPIPSAAYIEDAVKTYYETQSYWADERIMTKIESLSVGQETGAETEPEFDACIKYDFASINSATQTKGTTSRIFNFVYINGQWVVVKMGDWNSC